MQTPYSPWSLPCVFEVLPRPLGPLSAGRAAVGGGWSTITEVLIPGMFSAQTHSGVQEHQSIKTCTQVQVQIANRCPPKPHFRQPLRAES